MFRVMSQDPLIVHARTQAPSATPKPAKRMKGLGGVPKPRKSQANAESERAWEDARRRSHNTIDAAKQMTFGIKTIEPRTASAGYNINTGLPGKESISMENPRQFNIPNMSVNVGSIGERADLKEVMEQRISMVLRREFAMFVIKHKASEKTTDQLADEFLAEHAAPAPVQAEPVPVAAQTARPIEIADVPMTPVTAALTQPATSRKKHTRKTHPRKPRTNAELVEVRDAGEDVVYYGRRRRNQWLFRADAEFNCFGRCLITQVSTRRCEAAHLVPHARKGGASFKNGILLRADLHTLFDLGEMAIDPETLEVHFSAEALEDDADLRELHGKPLHPTRNPINAEYLRARWDEFIK